MSIPSSILQNTIFNFSPILENWAFVTLVFVLIFYARLSVKMAFKIAIFSAFCLLSNYYISTIFSLWKFSLLLFIIAWIGQFYGHQLEGKKPSFLKDLQFLLIGPAWVIQKIF